MGERWQHPWSKQNKKSYPKKNEAITTEVGWDTVNFPSDVHGPILNSTQSGYPFEQWDYEIHQAVGQQEQLMHLGLCEWKISF